MVKILYIGNKLTRHGFTPGVIDMLGTLLEKEGYNVAYAGTYKNRFLRFAEMVWKTLTLGRKVGYILIDTYSTSAFWYAYFCGRLAKIIGKKNIPILHGGDLPARLKSSKWACDKLFKNSYANVAVSGYLSYEFEKAGYKTIVIPNSIDISKYPFRLRERPRPKLLWVRSFHRQYNPFMAADVLAKLFQYFPDSELCMVGPDKDGSMEEFRKYISLKGIENKVKIKGKLSKEDWIVLSENYDFFLNTTNVDNTPVSVIEAMALGLLVVSTNVGGIPYLLEHKKDAYLVETQNAEQMTNSVLELMHNSELASQLMQNARKKAESFGWEKVKRNWIELLS